MGVGISKRSTLGQTHGCGQDDVARRQKGRTRQVVAETGRRWSRREARGDRRANLKKAGGAVACETGEISEVGETTPV